MPSVVSAMDAAIPARLGTRENDLEGLQTWLLERDPKAAVPMVDWFDDFDGTFEVFPFLKVK